MNIMQNMLIKFSVNLLFLHIIAAEPDCFLCCLTWRVCLLSFWLHILIVRIKICQRSTAITSSHFACVNITTSFYTFSTANHLTCKYYRKSQAFTFEITNYFIRSVNIIISCCLFVTTNYVKCANNYYCHYL